MRWLAFKSRPEEEGGGERRYVDATVVDVILFVLFRNRANSNNNNKLSFVAMNSQSTKYMHAYCWTQCAQIWHGGCFQPERGQDDSGDINYCMPGQRRALFLVAKLRK